ncbi:MAG: hypothetical protein ACXQS2_02745 [Methermicoccaceae archaeon]
MPRVTEEEVRELFSQGFGYLTKDKKKRILDADGLLVLAGKKGLIGVKTELLHYSYDEKTARAVVKATVSFDDGSQYEAMCELTDRDVQHPKYFLRACETRAVARALRFAFAMPMAFEVEKGELKPAPKPKTKREIEDVEKEEERLIAEAEEAIEEGEDIEW